MHVCLYINQERQKESCCGIVSFFCSFACLFVFYFIILSSFFFLVEWGTVFERGDTENTGFG